MFFKNVFHLMIVNSLFLLIVSCSGSNSTPEALSDSALSGETNSRQASASVKGSPEEIENFKITNPDRNNTFSNFDNNTTTSGSPAEIENIDEVIDKPEIPNSDKSDEDTPSDKNTISWFAPSERENGDNISPYELKKYIIYYGTSSKVYTGYIEISNKINNMLPTSISVDHLEPNVIYYFSGLTVDSNEIRSVMSNEISKLILP